MGKTYSDVESEPWIITVVLLEGLRLMRPEKSWRPIVVMSVDNHEGHETTLGADGQCVNQREAFEFSEATPTSTIEFNVFHKSQSKKKGKKRNLVASSSYSLGELLKKSEHAANLDIRLNCRPDGKAAASRGRPQNKASLRIRLKAPENLSWRRKTVLSSTEEERTCNPGLSDGESCSSSSSSSSSSECSSSASQSRSGSNSTPIQTSTPSLLQSTLRRRRKKPRPFFMDSEDERMYKSEYSEVEEEIDDGCVRIVHGTEIEEESTSITYVDPEDTTHSESLLLQTKKRTTEWIAASLLPVYTEKLTTSPELGRMEKAIAACTMYGELKTACVDSHYEKVFSRLQMEWTYTGGTLVALSAVDAAVFSISNDSLFSVDSYARSAIAASSIFSGLGVACDAWFLLRYSWADIQTFKARSKDVYDSYFFFSLSSRVPSLCMFMSAISLMSFLALVSFSIWPQGVLFVSFMIGFLMTSQFLVYGTHWVGKRMLDGGREVGGVVRRLTVGSGPA